MDETETHWTIQHQRHAELAAVNAKFNARLAALREACPHTETMGWLMDWADGYSTKCWRKCCKVCFATLQTTYTRPEGAIG